MEDGSLIFGIRVINISFLVYLIASHCTPLMGGGIKRKIVGCEDFLKEGRGEFGQMLGEGKIPNKSIYCYRRKTTEIGSID